MASKKPGSKTAASPAVSALTLAALMSATSSGGILYASAESAAPLVSAGHAEQNPSMTNDAGEFATRITAAGKAAYEAVNGAASAQSNNSDHVPVPKFTITKGIPIPPRTRVGGGRESIYPWAEMEVGDSFFVPNKKTDKFGSTLATGRKQFLDAEGNKTRDFKAANITEDGVEGLRVWRVA